MSRRPGAVGRTIASHALAGLGMSLPWPLLLLLVWERSGDGWALGLAGAARMLPYVALSWWAGRLADRVSRDRIVRLTLVARMVLLAVTAVALGAGQTWLAVCAATCAVAVATPAYPALAAAMPGLAGARTERATSLLVTCEVASFVAGPALGGLLLAPGTRWLVPWVAVACVLVAWWLFEGVRLAAPLAADAAIAPGRGSGVMAAMRGSGALRGAVATVAVVNAAAALVGLALLPLSRAWDGRADGRSFGIATAALGLGALGGPVLGRLGLRRGWGARVWLVVLGASLALVVPARSLWIALAPLAVAGAAAVQVEIQATATVQHAAADRLRASVLGLTDTVMVAAALLGALVAPTLATVVGPRAVLVLAAVGTVVAVVLVRRPAVGVEPVAQPARVAA